MTIDFSKLVGGYAIQQEDRAGLLRTSSRGQLLKVGDTPDRVDPRKHLLWDDGLLRIEDQKNQGSCQGQALSECVEFCYSVVAGKVLQFSRQYCYIGSQIFDGIRGDSGSTLSGGTKLAEQGVCTEATAPYANGYPGHGYITSAMKEEAKKYRLQSHTTIESSDHMREYIGSGIGIVQIGISWNGSMSPDSNGCIRSFSGGGGGGHSVVFCGYLPDDEVGQRSSKGFWHILKNSWGTRWGDGGFVYVDPSAVEAMLRHNFSVFIGRSDMKGDDIKPRPLPVDFTKPGKSMYA